MNPNNTGVITPPLTPPKTSQSTAPGAFPTPDFQGMYETCTSHAVAKTILNGYQMGKFTNGLSIDMDQNVVTQVLLNEIKDIKAIYPTDFHGRLLLLHDAKKEAWKTQLSVCGVPPADITRADSQKASEFVISYKCNGSVTPHAVYVDKVSSGGILHCINSWGAQDPFPSVKISDVETLYRVTFTAQRISSPSPAPAAPVALPPSPHPSPLKIKVNTPNC